MIVRMRTTAAGPDGIFLAGKLYDLPKAIGQRFVDTGCAEVVKSKEGKKESILEVTSLESAPETTTKQKSRPIGRKRADTP